MVKDAVVNVVERLRQRGCDPRFLDHDLWQARCPAHRSTDHALFISRNEFNHVELNCRSTQKCAYGQIIAALGLTNQHVYAETHDSVITELERLAQLQAAEMSRTKADPSPEATAPAAPAVGTLEDPGHPPPDSATGEPQSSLTVLTRLTSTIRLFRASDGRFCAQVKVGKRREIYGLKSAAFRDWLIDGYLAIRSEPPSNLAIRRVVAMLEARTRFGTGIPEVFVRIGQQPEEGALSYCLDLGDPSGRAVAICDEGWFVVDQPSIDFRRPEGLLPLPAPDRDGSIELLRRYVNLTEHDFRLMITWLTAALRPVGPYPVLVLNGEQASGKSTLARILRFLIDPQTCPVLALPSSTHDLMATALNGWLLVYENISTIPNWFSDTICQLAFGGGFASRTLFTNDERSVIYAQRPVILVGIDDFVVRGDLRDRSVFLHLPPLGRTSRQTERKFWSEFHRDYPLILGGVLNAVVGGLRELPSVDLKELPRMADYAEWGEATSRSLGWGAGTFLSAYNANRVVATEAILEESPVATVALELSRQGGINWSGSPVALYDALSKAGAKTAGSNWPKSVHQFARELRRVAPQLRLHGLSIRFERKNLHRTVTVKSDTAGEPAANSNSL